MLFDAGNNFVKPTTQSDDDGERCQIYLSNIISYCCSISFNYSWHSEKVSIFLMLTWFFGLLLFWIFDEFCWMFGFDGPTIWFFRKCSIGNFNRNIHYVKNTNLELREVHSIKRTLKMKFHSPKSVNFISNFNKSKVRSGLRTTRTDRHL